MLNVGLIAAGGWGLAHHLAEKAGQQDSVAEIARPTPAPAITAHPQPVERRQADEASLRLQRAKEPVTEPAIPPETRARLTRATQGLKNGTARCIGGQVFEYHRTDAGTTIEQVRDTICHNY